MTRQFCLGNVLSDVHDTQCLTRPLAKRILKAAACDRIGTLVTVRRRTPEPCWPSQRTDQCLSRRRNTTSDGDRCRRPSERTPRLEDAMKGCSVAVQQEDVGGKIINAKNTRHFRDNIGLLKANNLPTRKQRRVSQHVLLQRLNNTLPRSAQCRRLGSSPTGGTFS